MRDEERLTAILASYGMVPVLVSVERQGDSGESRRLDARIIVPSADALCRLLDLGAKAAAISTDAIFIYRLTLLYEMAQDPQRRLLRRPSPTAIWRSQCVRETSGARTVPALVRRLAPSHDRSIGELLDFALYAAGPIQPVDEQAYFDFREDVLCGVDELWQRVSDGDIGERAFGVAKRRHLKRGVAIKPTAGIKQQWKQHLDRNWARVLRTVLLTASEMSRDTLGPLEPLADRAKQLLGGDEVDPGAIDALIADTADTLARRAGDGWATTFATSLRRAAWRADPVEKVEALEAIDRYLRPGGCQLELLLREVDAVPWVLIELGASVVLRKIRKYLTPPERRLFAFLYSGCSTPFKFPFIDALLADDELGALTVAVVGHKQRDLGPSLEALFRRHLTFYASWARTVREDDRDRKRAERRPKEIGLVDRHLPTVEPEEIETASVSPPFAQGRFTQVFNERLKGRPLKRHEVARLYFVEGMTQNAIANQLSVSQQAVSRAIDRCLEKDLCDGAPPKKAVKESLRAMGLLRRGRRKSKDIR